MSQALWLGHCSAGDDSRGRGEEGGKLGGLSPIPLNEALWPLRPPVPTPWAEPLALGGLAEGRE